MENRQIPRAALLGLSLLGAVHAGGVMADSVRDTVFASKSGEHIILNDQFIVTPLGTEKIASCADSENWCLQAADGFRVRFPKKCPDKEYWPSDGNFIGSGLSVLNVGRMYSNYPLSRYRYFWSSPNGLAGIAIVSYDKSEIKYYYYVSGPRVLKCI